MGALAGKIVGILADAKAGKVWEWVGRSLRVSWNTDHSKGFWISIKNLAMADVCRISNVCIHAALCCERIWSDTWAASVTSAEDDRL